MMKEEMLELAAAASDPEAKRAVLRGCLRASLLRSFHEAEAFLSVALISEGEAGLEFALLDKKDYKPERWLFAAKRRLWFMGLDPPHRLRAQAVGPPGLGQGSRPPGRGGLAGRSR